MEKDANSQFASMILLYSFLLFYRFFYTSCLGVKLNVFLFVKFQARYRLPVISIETENYNNHSDKGISLNLFHQTHWKCTFQIQSDWNTYRLLFFFFFQIQKVMKKEREKKSNRKFKLKFKQKGTTHTEYKIQCSEPESVSLTNDRLHWVEMYFYICANRFSNKNEEKFVDPPGTFDSAIVCAHITITISLYELCATKKAKNKWNENPYSLKSDAFQFYFSRCTDEICNWRKIVEWKHISEFGSIKFKGELQNENSKLWLIFLFTVFFHISFLGLINSEIKHW